MKKSQGRRNFIKTTASAAIGMSFLSNPLVSGKNQRFSANHKRIGIIGLDTSHSIAFTEAF
ncbi:MAG: twin-arginine translocation signal domain-containing protein, partial [Bacteroidota bacterium]